MESLIITLRTIDDTEKLGRLLGTHAEPGWVIALDGQMGAGKTALSQAIARGLEVPENCYVTSPSFAILHEYQGRMPMYHMDFYRLEVAAEVGDMGFEEYFYLDGLSVIEWSLRAREILPEARLMINLQVNSDLSRRAELSGGDSCRSLFSTINKEFDTAGKV